MTFWNSIERPIIALAPMEDVTDTVLRELLLDTADPSALHVGMTEFASTNGLADWAEIAKAVQLRGELGLTLPIIGNGDVQSIGEARKKCTAYHLDGAMIGHGIFNNPWLFMEEQHERTKEEKLAMPRKHTQLFDRIWQGSKNFHILQRCYSIYAKGFSGAADLRAKLMRTENIKAVEQILHAIR